MQCTCEQGVGGEGGPVSKAAADSKTSVALILSSFALQALSCEMVKSDRWYRMMVAKNARKPPTSCNPTPPILLIPGYELSARRSFARRQW